MEFDNLKLMNSDEMGAQKYVSELIQTQKQWIDDEVFNISEYLGKINKEIENSQSITTCPSYIEFSARYSFNDGNELRSVIRNFFKLSLKNDKSIIINPELENIVKVSVLLSECLDEEGVEDFIEYALYFVGKDSTINTEDFTINLGLSAYETIVTNLGDVIQLITELEKDEYSLLDNYSLENESSKIINFYKYCELIRRICELLPKLSYQ